ncbi:MAG: hypothetical protein ABIN20_00710 [candidate division WOR-3 bacterium]
MIKLFLLFAIILEKEKEKIEEYLNYLWKEDYLSAIELEKGYFNKYKDHPILYSLKTIRYFEYFLDFYEPDSEEKFFKSIEKGLSLCDKYKGKDKDIVFLEGVFLAFSAMFEGLRENYLQALTKGFKAYNIIKKFKNYPDSYLALGIYDYGASILQKYVGKTFIKGDRRQKGVEEVKVSILRGVFMKANSYDALIEIFLREKMRDSAFKWAEKFYQEFGESRRTLFTLGSAYRRSGYFEKAEKIYLKLLPMVENQNSNYNKGIVRLYLSECYYVLNKNKEEAKKLINEAEIYLEKSRWYRKEKVLEYLKKLKRQKFFN